jgi:putative FmdB family regulatory protein
VPTYQYSCTECGHFFEQFQTFSEDSLTECPQCQGRLRKVFNAVGVVFKGSGFYRTDSRSTAEKGDGGSTPTPAEKSPATSGDSKPSAPASGTTSSAPSTPAASGSSTSAA